MDKAAYNRRWRQANPEKAAEAQARYRSTEQYKIMKNAAQKRYRARKKEEAQS